MTDDEHPPSGSPPWARPPVPPEAAPPPSFVPPSAPPGSGPPGWPGQPGSGGPGGPGGPGQPGQPGGPGQPAGPAQPGSGGYAPGVVVPPAPAEPPPPRPPGGTGDDEPSWRDRPRPQLGSLLAAAGGLVATAGLFALLSDPDIGDERIKIVAVSLVFEVLGLALALFHRSHRAGAGGVALSALAAIPLVQAAFPEPSARDLFLDGSTSLRNTQLGILTGLAVIWLLCYLLGPTRRYGFYLGAALYAFWQIPMTWFSFNAVDAGLGALSTGVEDLLGGSGSTSSSFDPFTASSDSTALKLGLTSLVFAVAYLALGAWADRLGDHRLGTPFFAVAPLAGISAVSYLQEDFKVGGTAVVGLVLGGASIWLGVQARRRFTAWIGVAAVVGAVVSVVGDVFDDPVPAGLVLAFVGTALVVGAGVAEAAGLLPGGDRQEPEPPPSTPI